MSAYAYCTRHCSGYWWDPDAKAERDSGGGNRIWVPTVHDDVCTVGLDLPDEKRRLLVAVWKGDVNDDGFDTGRWGPPINVADELARLIEKQLVHDAGPGVTRRYSLTLRGHRAWRKDPDWTTDEPAAVER